VVNAGYVSTGCPIGGTIDVSLLNYAPGADIAGAALLVTSPPEVLGWCVWVSAPTHILVDGFGVFTRYTWLDKSVVS
jgi:hypothetical protein